MPINQTDLHVKEKAIMEKTSKLTMALEQKVDELIQDARKRRAYVHALAMLKFTPKQYARAIPMFTKQGYGVNVFPMHHVHPPLSMAIVGEHMDAVLALLMAGADPHMSYPTVSGRTCPLQTLIEQMIKHRKTPRRYKKYEQMLNTMMSYGANLQKAITPASTKTYQSWLDEEKITLA